MASEPIPRRILYKRIHITRKQRQALTALVPNNKKTRVHLSRINIALVLEFDDGDSHHIKLLRDPCGNVLHIGRLLLLILSTLADLHSQESASPSILYSQPAYSSTSSSSDH